MSTTVTAAKTRAAADVGVDADADAAPARRQRSRAERILVQISFALTLALVFLVGFVGYLYGLSSLSEHRTQANLRKTFAHTLGQAIAPVGPVAPGTPVAVIEIPEIGLNGAVVVEGTSARDLSNGPGHRPDSVLPGQAGVSVIYGRRNSFGAPFAQLLHLQVGNPIKVTTGQGVATYRVSSFGDGTHPAPANSANRLVLVTANSAGVPHSTVSVSADLLSKAQPGGGSLPAAQPDEVALAWGWDQSLLPLLLWSQALVALAIVTTLAANRWSRLATYLFATPVALAVLWNVYENLACVLPNVY